MSAEKNWRRLRGFEWLAKVINGVKFRDGIEVQQRVRKADHLAAPPGAGHDQIGPPAWRVALDDGLGRRSLA